MSELSPAAQAVLDAFLNGYIAASKSGVAFCDDRKALAAALRAATDQVVPEQQIPRGRLVNLGRDTIEVFPQGARIPMQRLRLLQEVRINLLAIANELENHQ